MHGLSVGVSGENLFSLFSNFVSICLFFVCLFSVCFSF